MILSRVSDIFLADPNDYTLDPGGLESEKVTKAATFLAIYVLIEVCSENIKHENGHMDVLRHRIDIVNEST